MRCMLEAVESFRNLLEVLHVLEAIEVMRCVVLLCMLEAVEVISVCWKCWRHALNATLYAGGCGGWICLRRADLFAEALEALGVMRCVRLYMLEADSLFAGGAGDDAMYATLYAGGAGIDALDAGGCEGGL